MQPRWAENTYFKNIKNHTELLNSSIYLFVSKFPQTVQRNTYCIYAFFPRSGKSKLSDQRERMKWSGVTGVDSSKFYSPLWKLKNSFMHYGKIYKTIWEMWRGTSSPDEAHTLKQTIDKDREDKFQR